MTVMAIVLAVCQGIGPGAHAPGRSAGLPGHRAGSPRAAGPPGAPRARGLLVCQGAAPRARGLPGHRAGSPTGGRARTSFPPVPIAPAVTILTAA